MDERGSHVVIDHDWDYRCSPHLIINDTAMQQEINRKHFFEGRSVVDIIDYPDG